MNTSNRHLAPIRAQENADEVSTVLNDMLFFRFHLVRGIARRLVKVALQEAAKKREKRYSDMKKIDRGIRRHFHDDITVIVVFLDSNIVSCASLARGPIVSLKVGGASLLLKTQAPFS